jgi:hydrogenase-4 component B
MTAFALAFCVLAVLAGIVAVTAPGRRGRRVFVALVVAQALVACAFSAWALSADLTRASQLWTLSILGPLTVQVTSLGSVLFLVSAFVFAATVAPIAHDADTAPTRRSGAAVLLAFEALFLVTPLLLFAGDVITFIFAWELMSLLVFVLVSTRITDAAVPRAGFVTLAMSEAGSLAAIVALLVLATEAHSPQFSVISQAAAGLPAPVAWTVFLLAVLGFGVKAGLVPVNAWLPDAYGASPGAVPAVLSGVTLNFGFFAVLTVVGRLLPADPAFGVVVMLLGSLTALLGIVYANTDSDLKRLLAHSSIENMGIALTGAGGGLCFVALHQPVLGAMLLIAGLYHAVNHSVFKSLLFLGADGVQDSCGTTDMDRLGGLLRRLPLFGALFLAGTLAIAGLPPFNGFVSEWLTLEGLLRVVEVHARSVRLAFAVSGALLALTAGLAVTCFVMVFGSSFTGLGRSRAAAAARSVSRMLTVPMAVLAAACLALGLLPTLVVPVLGRAVEPIAGADGTAALVPDFFHATSADTHGIAPALYHDLSTIGAQVGKRVLPGRSMILLHEGGSANPVVFAMSTFYSAVVLILMLASVYLVFWRLRRRRAVRRSRVWDGGLTALPASMTYTATAFASPVRTLFDSILRPEVEEETEYHERHFRSVIRRRVNAEHIVDRVTLKPVASALRAVARFFARLHHGSVNAYAGYILLMLLLALALGLVVRPL